MFLTYADGALSALVVGILSDAPAVDLQDVSDTVTVEMEEIHGLVVQDFERTATGVELNVEETTLTAEEVIAALIECVESFRDYTLPILIESRKD